MLGEISFCKRQSPRRKGKCLCQSQLEPRTQTQNTSIKCARIFKCLWCMVSAYIFEQKSEPRLIDCFKIFSGMGSRGSSSLQWKAIALLHALSYTTLTLADVRIGRFPMETLLHSGMTLVLWWNTQTTYILACNFSLQQNGGPRKCRFRMKVNR